MRKSPEEENLKDKVAWPGTPPTIKAVGFCSNGVCYFESEDAVSADIVVNGKVIKGTVVNCNLEKQTCNVMYEKNGVLDIWYAELACTVTGQPRKEEQRDPRIDAEIQRIRSQRPTGVVQSVKDFHAVNEPKAHGDLPTEITPPKTVLDIRHVPKNESEKSRNGCGLRIAIIAAGAVALAVAACNQFTSNPSKEAEKRVSPIYPVGKWKVENMDHSQLSAILQNRGVQWWTDKDEEECVRENFRFGRSKAPKEYHISGDNLVIVAAYNKDTRMLHISIGEEWEVVVSEAGDATLVTEITQK